MNKCRCGEEHEEITQEQIIDAEMRKPLRAREHDPFPHILGNRTVDFSSGWRSAGVLLSDKAAALCTTPDELNREEVAAEGELLRHIKAGLVPVGGRTPPWAREIRSTPPPVEKPKNRGGRPKKTRKKETAPRNLTPEQRLARADNAAKARAAKAARRAAYV